MKLRKKPLKAILKLTKLYEIKDLVTIDFLVYKRRPS